MINSRQAAKPPQYPTTAERLFVPYIWNPFSWSSGCTAACLM